MCYTIHVVGDIHLRLWQAEYQHKQGVFNECRLPYPLCWRELPPAPALIRGALFV